MAKSSVGTARSYNVRGVFVEPGDAILNIYTEETGTREPQEAKPDVVPKKESSFAPNRQNKNTKNYGKKKRR